MRFFDRAAFWEGVREENGEENRKRTQRRDAEDAEKNRKNHRRAYEHQSEQGGAHRAREECGAGRHDGADPAAHGEPGADSELH